MAERTEIVDSDDAAEVLREDKEFKRYLRFVHAKRYSVVGVERGLSLGGRGGHVDLKLPSRLHSSIQQIL